MCFLTEVGDDDDGDDGRNDDVVAADGCSCRDDDDGDDELTNWCRYDLRSITIVIVKSPRDTAAMVRSKSFESGF